MFLLKQMSFCHCFNVFVYPVCSFVSVVDIRLLLLHTFVQFVMCRFYDNDYYYCCYEDILKCLCSVEGAAGFLHGFPVTVSVND